MLRNEILSFSSVCFADHRRIAWRNEQMNMQA
jgi:hypothetical protein